MNNSRRTLLSKATDFIEKTIEIVEEVRDEGQGSLDNIPENLQNTERYETMEQAVKSLENALDSLNEAVDEIDSAMD